MDNKEIIYDIKQTWEGGATLSALALALTQVMEKRTRIHFFA